MSISTRPFGTATSRSASSIACISWAVLAWVSFLGVERTTRTRSGPLPTLCDASSTDCTRLRQTGVSRRGARNSSERPILWRASSIGRSTIRISSSSGPGPSGSSGSSTVSFRPFPQELAYARQASYASSAWHGMSDSQTARPIRTSSSALISPGANWSIRRSDRLTFTVAVPL